MAVWGLPLERVAGSRARDVRHWSLWGELLLLEVRFLAPADRFGLLGEDVFVLLVRCVPVEGTSFLDSLHSGEFLVLAVYGVRDSRVFFESCHFGRSRLVVRVSGQLGDRYLEVEDFLLALLVELFVDPAREFLFVLRDRLHFEVVQIDDSAGVLAGGKQVLVALSVAVGRSEQPAPSRRVSAIGSSFW